MIGTRLRRTRPLELHAATTGITSGLLRSLSLPARSSRRLDPADVTRVMSFRRTDACPPPDAVSALVRAPAASAFPSPPSPFTLATAEHPGSALLTIELVVPNGQ
jgi:hypothetical protein